MLTGVAEDIVHCSDAAEQRSGDSATAPFPRVAQRSNARL